VSVDVDVVHDVLCELGNELPAFNRPPLGFCWCADRAEGYVFWTWSIGAASTEASRVPPGEVPPNVGGAP
jgi:hypothetical protein